LVSPQIILVTLALIAFFATGGIGKAQRALVTAKSDFTTVKGSLTGFKEKLGEFTGKQSVSLSNTNDPKFVMPTRETNTMQQLSLRSNFVFPTNPEAVKQKLDRGI